MKETGRELVKVELMGRRGIADRWERGQGLGRPTKIYGEHPESIVKQRSEKLKKEGLIG